MVHQYVALNGLVKPEKRILYTLVNTIINIGNINIKINNTYNKMAESRFYNFVGNLINLLQLV